MKRTPTTTAGFLVALVLVTLIPQQATARYGQPETIHAAASRGNIDQLKSFIEKGTDLDQPNRRRQTPLGLAVQSNRVEAVTLLLNSGAKPDKLSDGIPPLVTAILRRSSDIVPLLLEKGANVNLADSGKRTPLLVASEIDHLELVKALVAKGADVNAKDSRGQTPLSVAQRNRYTAVADFLKQNGAQELDTGYGRGPYGRDGYESSPDGPQTQGSSRRRSSTEPSVLEDPNLIREHIAAHAGLSETLVRFDANAVSIGRSWASRRSDNRTTLIRAVAKQVNTELTFLHTLANTEKAPKTIEAITKLQAERKGRYELIGSELRTARRLAQQEARATTTGRGRGRGSSRSGRGAPARGEAPGRYGDPSQMADPYGPPPARPSRGRTTTEAVPEKPLDPDTQAQLDEWLRANPEDKRDLLGAVHDLDLLDYASLRQVAVEEEAKKTTAAIEGLMLARQTRHTAILTKMAADDERLQRMTDRYGTPTGPGRGRRGQATTQPADQATPRRRRR